MKTRQRNLVPDVRDSSLEGRCLMAISTATTVVKIPGPTDVVVVTATNPAGNQVPGQSSTLTLSNREARQLA
jgi:hypothetical protein